MNAPLHVPTAITRRQLSALYWLAHRRLSQRMTASFEWLLRYEPATARALRTKGAVRWDERGAALTERGQAFVEASEALGLRARASDRWWGCS